MQAVQNPLFCGNSYQHRIETFPFLRTRSRPRMSAPYSDFRFPMPQLFSLCPSVTYQPAVRFNVALLLLTSELIQRLHVALKRLKLAALRPPTFCMTRLRVNRTGGPFVDNCLVNSILRKRLTE